MSLILITGEEWLGSLKHWFSSFLLCVFHVCLYYTVLSVPFSRVITYWKRADLLAPLCVIFPCVTFPYAVSGQALLLILSIPDFCLLRFCLPFLVYLSLSHMMFRVRYGTWLYRFQCETDKLPLMSSKGSIYSSHSQLVIGDLGFMLSKHCILHCALVHGPIMDPPP